MNNCEEINIEKIEREIKVTPKVEKIIEGFLKEIGLNHNLQALIKAFLHISKGGNYFEASRNEIAVIMYGQYILRDKDVLRNKSDSVRYHLNSLSKWQKARGLEIIGIVTLGNRVQMTDGTFDFNKTRYHFTLLDEVLKMIPADSMEDFEISFEKIIEALKAQYRPVESRKHWHPKHKIQKAINTILTKINTIYALNIEAKTNPVESFERVLREISNRIEHWNNEWREQEDIDDFMTNFELLWTGLPENEELPSQHNKENELPLEP